jgi:cellobiose phosphorylase
MHEKKTYELVRLTGSGGLSVEINSNGSIRRMDCGDTTVNLFLGNELEGGPANLYLRRRALSRTVVEFTPLLGPRSPTRSRLHGADNRWVGSGTWRGIGYTVTLVLSQTAPAWFWHVTLENIGEAPRNVDLVYAQDMALAPYGTVRLNEYYVSQYVDHTPLTHAARGWVVASRQNLAANGRNPWCVIGSLRRGKTFATDALQVHGLASRVGANPEGLADDLPTRRLQHEHSMVAIRDESLRLEPDSRATLGFFGSLIADHPEATSEGDLAYVDQALALPEASPTPVEIRVHPGQNESIAAGTLFSTAPLVAALDLTPAEAHAMFAGEWRHQELDGQGKLLSFFYDAERHVVLREKELHTRRPHGHLLRTGRHATPDETALTSTTWMAGVFHSMLTQGHVSFNRFLSTVHSYIGLFRSHGQRVFVEFAGGWQLLDVPSAFEASPDCCRWIYRHAHTLIEVRSEAQSDPHEMLLTIQVHSGGPRRCLVSHHVALGGDDGSTAGPVNWTRDEECITVRPTAGSDLATRFPEGNFQIVATQGTTFDKVGGDELLFLDGQSRQQPYVCVVIAPGSSMGLRLRGHLVEGGIDVPDEAPPAAIAAVKITAPTTSPLADAVARLTDIAPWFTHNAQIHYLAPRGLEQYSGGGWGTRDVTQGPVEMLLALGNTGAVRDLLLRVMSAQNPDGDWPQWFMFFERDRNIRASDSHGDIVFWPVLALAQYLIASADAGLLSQNAPFFAQGADQPETATVWQHVERALAVIDQRVIQGTALAAYGHGDWNDALQPADPAMREHMCSAWTVTLHHQMLVTLARALRLIARESDAAAFEAKAESVQRDFQRLLLVDGVLTGYALFDGADVRYLLHPRDATTGVHYSALAMIHAVLDDMLTPAQAQEHLQLIQTHLCGPDGVRLFDRPMPYHGGPQRFFQRAESATFFGREIGLMYMHAHLRYAQALAHVGEADRFFHALCQANPIGIRTIVPAATLRQANCYYSSSDAAFADRYQASAEYGAVATGEIALDGGWRVYSSGAGIALALIIRRFLGLTQECGTLSIDPVMPATLDGLRVKIELLGKPFDVVYDVRGAGCGVTAVSLNGTHLELTYDYNPYRKGAARVAADSLAALLKGERNDLEIRVG